MIWDLLTSNQIGNLDKNLPVILPISATEQHGPHLPIATDRLIGEHFVQKIEERMKREILVLPSMSVGCSDHHMDFSGTLTHSHQLFSGLVKEIVSSVIKHGFNKIVIFNSHGGNQGVGQVVVEQLGYEYPAQHFVLVTWWKIAIEELVTISETGFGGVGHGGEFETSLMMLIAPELVERGKIVGSTNKPTFSWAEGDLLRSPKATYYKTMKQLTQNGVFGDPTRASREKGEKITSVVLDSFHQILADLINADKA